MFSKVPLGGNSGYYQKGNGKKAAVRSAAEIRNIRSGPVGWGLDSPLFRQQKQNPQVRFGYWLLCGALDRGSASIRDNLLPGAGFFADDLQRKLKAVKRAEKQKGEEQNRGKKAHKWKHLLKKITSSSKSAQNGCCVQPCRTNPLNDYEEPPLYKDAGYDESFQRAEKQYWKQKQILRASARAAKSTESGFKQDGSNSTEMCDQSVNTDLGSSNESNSAESFDLPPLWRRRLVSPPAALQIQKAVMAGMGRSSRHQRRTA